MFLTIFSSTSFTKCTWKRFENVRFQISSTSEHSYKTSSFPKLTLIGIVSFVVCLGPRFFKSLQNSPGLSVLKRSIFALFRDVDEIVSRTIINKTVNNHGTKLIHDNWYGKIRKEMIHFLLRQKFEIVNGRVRSCNNNFVLMKRKAWFITYAWNV